VLMFRTYISDMYWIGIIEPVSYNQPQSIKNGMKHSRNIFGTQAVHSSFTRMCIISRVILRVMPSSSLLFSHKEDDKAKHIQFRCEI
jgi:hypothetical protein